MSIRILWLLLAPNIDILVGNGRKTSFGNDNWLGHGPLKDDFIVMRVLSLNRQVTVADSWDQQGWSFNFRRQLNDWELARFTAILKAIDHFKGTTDEEDRLKYRRHSQGQFTVNSAYTRLNHPDQQAQLWSWKSVWKVKLPSEVTYFVWLVVRDACLPQDNLKRRGMQLCSRCYLCGKEAESNCHLFIHCLVARVLWNPFLSMKGLSWIKPRTRGQLPSCWNFSGGLIRQKKWWKIIPGGSFGRKETIVVLKEQQLLTKD